MSKLVSSILSILIAVFPIGLLLTLTVMADTAEQKSPRGKGNGSLRLSSVRERLFDAEPARVPLGPTQRITILSEDFEGSWPTGNWQVFDDDGATNGEYYWANRCLGHNSARSAWGTGGGDGGGLPCGADYPNLLDSWIVYGPMDLGQATDAAMTFYFWVNTECTGTNCADKQDRFWATASSDGVNFNGTWWAGGWPQDSSADPNGWVAGSLDLSSFAGQSQVWIAFIFDSDSTVTYPGGAYVDDVVVQTSAVACPDFAPPSGTVGMEDVDFIANLWRQTSFWPRDCDADGRITVEDIMCVAKHLGETCSTEPPPLEVDSVHCLLAIARLRSPSDYQFFYYGCVSSSHTSSHISLRYNNLGQISGFDVTLRDVPQDMVLYQASINIDERNSLGQVVSYSGPVSVSGFPPFTETIVNGGHDGVGGVTSADVTKVYTATGNEYTMDLTPCYAGLQWTGYRVKVWGGPFNGEEIVVDDCG